MARGPWEGPVAYPFGWPGSNVVHRRSGDDGGASGRQPNDEYGLDAVVVPPPLFDHETGFLAGTEHLAVEEFAPNLRCDTQPRLPRLSFTVEACQSSWGPARST